MKQKLQAIRYDSTDSENNDDDKQIKELEEVYVKQYF